MIDTTDLTPDRTDLIYDILPLSRDEGMVESHGLYVHRQGNGVFLTDTPGGNRLGATYCLTGRNWMGCVEWLEAKISLYTGESFEGEGVVA